MSANGGHGRSYNTAMPTFRRFRAPLTRTVVAGIVTFTLLVATFVPALRPFLARPERDTPEVVRAYVRAFDPTFVGLSGTPAQTAEAASNYRIVYRKVPNGPSYDMEHTALTFMVDPRGRVRLAFPHAQSAQDCADDIGKLITSDLDT
jgi:SCO1/SenC